MLFMFTALVTLIVDQVTKYMVVSHMLPGESIPVLEPFFYLTYVLNPGAAFGILAHHRVFFVFVSLCFIAVVFLGYRFLPKDRLWLRLALGLVVGGAVGNLIDRLRLGGVVDFFDFRVWPVFNIADSAIVIGVLLMFLEMWRSEKKQSKELR